MAPGRRHPHQIAECDGRASGRPLADQWKLVPSRPESPCHLVAFGLAVGQITTNQLRDNYAADTGQGEWELPRSGRGAVAPGHPWLSAMPARAQQPARLGERSGRRDDADKQDPLPAAEHMISVTLRPLRGSPPTTAGRLPPPSSISPRTFRPRSPGSVSAGRWSASTRRSGGSGIDRGRCPRVAAAGGARRRDPLRAGRCPISTLTSAASQIARTRDPDVTLAEPEGDDEVARLTGPSTTCFHELSIAGRTRAIAEAATRIRRRRLTRASRSPDQRARQHWSCSTLPPPAGSGNGDRDFEIESVESALRSSERMTRLVADLQLLAKADSERYRDTVPCDLSEIAANVAAELRPLSDNHDRARHAGGGGGRRQRDDLTRVILNLIDNAIGIPRREHDHGDDQARPRYRRDPGRGRSSVPEEMWPTIFDRFVRHDGRGDRRGKAPDSDWQSSG